MVTFLWRAAGCPVVDSAIPFKDVPSNAFYSDAVKWAVKEGITSGISDTMFGPDGIVTRGQVATFLWRYAGSVKAAKTAEFSDVQSSDFFYDAVSWASEQNITRGMGDGSFAALDSCTRGQVVTFLYRCVQK